MLLLTLTWIAGAFAQSLVPLDCYSIREGQLQLVTNMGCVEKTRSSGGDRVIYQIDRRRPARLADELPTVETKTMTLRLNKKDGKVVSYSKFEGEDPRRAPEVFTTIFKDQTNGAHGMDLRTQVTVREDGKETNLVTYDRDFCAKLHRSGNLGDQAGVITACAAGLAGIKRAALAFNKDLDADHAKLGVPGPRGYHAADVDGMLDLLTLVKRCHQYYFDEVPKAPGTSPPTPGRKVWPLDEMDGVAF